MPLPPSADTPMPDPTPGSPLPPPFSSAPTPAAVQKKPVWPWIVGGCGCLTLLLVVLVVVAAIGIPAFSKARDRAQATNSLAKAKGIAVACLLYASDHETKLPATLDELIPDYLPDKSVLASPLSPNSSTGYDYTPGLKETDPPKTVLLRDRNSSPSGLRATVYLDGSGEVN